MSRIRYVVTETLLWVAAAAGLLAMLLVAAAYFFNISLIMFSTGSMSPTIPAGSVSLVQEVDAADVEVGDVLTVERVGKLPVTHRVTSVAMGGTSDERVITMRGDANGSDDPSPYTIAEARVVLWSVPGVAPMINQMGSPYVLGGVTLAASLLVVWAFWPAKVSTVPGFQYLGRHRRRAVSGTLVMFTAAGVTGATFLFAPTAAQAGANGEEVVRETVRGQYVTLRSEYVPSERANMTPGDRARWEIEVTVNSPDPGVARTGLSVSGEFPLIISIMACDEAWSDQVTSSADPEGSCPGELKTLMETRTMESLDEVQWLDRFSSAEDRWLRIETTIPEDGDVSGGTSSMVRVHAEVSGEEISLTPGAESPAPAVEQGGKDQSSEGQAGAAPAETAGSGQDRFLVSEGGSAGRDAGPTNLDEGPSGLAETGAGFLWLLTLALGLVIAGRMLQKRGPVGSAESGEPR